jgi:hypothetical protein
MVEIGQGFIVAALGLFFQLLQSLKKANPVKG